jgi:uncharacterized membrane protein (UPF0127 family)
MFFFKKKENLETKTKSTSALVLFAVLIFMAIGVRLWQRYHLNTVTFSLKGQTIRLLVADTPARQNLGLGKRDNLNGYDGMLFTFPEAKQYGFVMREMRFPLDIVWFNKGKVVDIAPNLPIEPGVAETDLRVYYPRDVANAVIEFPAGWAAQHSLTIGEELTAL